MWIFEWVFGWFGSGQEAEIAFYYEWSEDNLFHSWEANNSHYCWQEDNLFHEWTDRS